MTGIFYFIHIGFFYLLLASLFTEEKKMRAFLKVFLISAGVFSLAALLSKDGLSLIYTAKPWTGFTFGNSTFAAMYLYPAFLLSIYFVISQPTKFHRWWKKLLPLIFVINPYIINRDVWLGKVNILENPAGIIGEAQATAIVVILSSIGLLFAWALSTIRSAEIRRKVLWVVLVAGIGAMVFAVQSFLSTDGYLRELYLRQASTARPIVWELSYKAIQDKPALGWGGDNFDRAFEKHYDNRLLEQKNGAEPWFDKAHNIFIDQTVETGYVGTGALIAVYLVIIASLAYVLFRSKKRNDVILAVLLLIYFAGHILELQTAFDTTISYVALAIMTAVAAGLFHRVYYEQKGTKERLYLPLWANHALGGAVLAVFGYLFIVGAVPIIRAESANGALRPAGSSVKRLPIYKDLFGAPVDQGTFLWRTISDFQKGVAEKPAILEDSKKREGLKQELDLFVQKTEEYLAQNPSDYRTHLTLANVYIYQNIFEVNNLEKAQNVLDDAILLVPQAPQAYWMKSVAYFYQGKFALAKEWAQKAYDLNPEAEQSIRLVEYIDESIKTFPEVTFYTFRQI